MKAVNLRNPKMVLHAPIATSKLEVLASKHNRAFFLRHPVGPRCSEMVLEVDFGQIDWVMAKFMFNHYDLMKDKQIRNGVKRCVQIIFIYLFKNVLETF